ncbi:unnamed protein product [Kuraishia capsulata CBS 1993]|uniref:Zinc finger PHD-type domain-containing protein n=1 Tax=Kuraishia capsulata CBS 1993 TaxID=1382522 RepID=W6MIF6_9ASCO|nr:uncharacterized protein KUCA_T00002215001 [Kuraishia capsulata CBS 1993]CDK26244.1 unnamed protein product [Kuraishia capsulata CBS 1993]
MSTVENSRKSTPAADESRSTPKPKPLTAKAQETQGLKLLKQQYQQYLKAPKYGIDSEELYCTCRKPDDGALMVCCDGCEGWWHFKCMDLPIQYQHLVAEFYCKFCDTLEGKGKTKWKRKCRLPSCYKPIKIDDGKASKYCSSEHGVEFLRSKLQGVENPEEITQALKRSEDLLSFQDLGKSLPAISEFPSDIQYKLNRLDLQVTELQDNLKTLSAQQQLLKRVKDRTKLISDCITSLKANEDISKFFNDEPLQQSKAKGKRKAQDICGYDKRLGDLGSMREMISEEFKSLKDLGFTEEKFKSDFEMYEALEDNADIPEDNYFAQICLQDKRKCAVHYSWFNIISEKVEFKLADDEYRVSTLKKKKDLVVRDATIRYWEGESSK